MEAADVGLDDVGRGIDKKLGAMHYMYIRLAVNDSVLLVGLN